MSRKHSTNKEYPLLGNCNISTYKVQPNSYTEKKMANICNYHLKG